MPAEVMYKGPTPPPGEQWCFVCAYTWKTALNDLCELTIKQAGREPDGSPTVWIDGTSGKELPPLAVAVATGLFGPMANLGPLNLCWSHLNAIRLQTASGLHLAAPGQMPGGGFPGMNGLGGH
jgi:hypothetical protein